MKTLESNDEEKSKVLNSACLEVAIKVRWGAKMLCLLLKLISEMKILAICLTRKETVNFVHHHIIYLTWNNI